MRVHLTPQQIDVLSTMVDYCIKQIESTAFHYDIDRSARGLCKRRLLEVKDILQNQRSK